MSSVIQAKKNAKPVSKRMQPNIDAAVLNLAPRLDWSAMRNSEHFVQVYETDGFLLDSLGGFIGTGLATGDACIVIATKAHLEGLEERLQTNGLDLLAARKSGQYLALDAVETLSQLMFAGSPEPGRFAQILGATIAGAAKRHNKVRLFGEMVALLWSEGNHQAAIQLEGLWNQLRETHSFSLLCAYPINGLAGETLVEPFSDICAAHSRVIPSESYATLEDADDRLRAVLRLQQKAKSFQAEIVKRQEAEERLRISETRYRRLFEAARDGILIVDPETHKITDANPFMTELLGFTPEELLDRELWELGLFADRETGLEALHELREKRVIRYDYLALKTKDGQPRAVEFVSNLYQANGHQVIQCNLRDVAERNRTEQLSSHLAAIVESSDDAIISKSLEGTILSWNRGAERIFGYSAEEIIGKPIYVLIPPDRIDEEPNIVERLRRGERIDHYETVRVAKDGRTIDISLTVSPIRDSSGKIIGASKIARDITERKQAEERLREQAEIIETINRIGQVLSAELNLQKVIQTVTDAATGLIGARFGMFIHNLEDNGGESLPACTFCGVSQREFSVYPTPSKTDLFGPTLRRDGVIRIADVRKDSRYGKSSPYYGMPPDYLSVTSYLAVPVISRSGEVLGGLYFGHPNVAVFTERDEGIVEGLAAQAAIAIDNARLYELAESERARAEEANRAKDEFLATISHELRTPLTAIIGWSHILLKPKLDNATMARAVETIDRNAKAQAQLIEDVLDVSRVITGKLRLNVGPVDMAAIINAAVDSVQLAADSKDIHLGVVLDTSARHTLGDSHRLKQVVWNLLSNAIKFTPSGGRVEVRLEQLSSEVQIKVSDTGEGIRPDFLPFVFERFRQAEAGTTRRHAGLGLGLAIVRHLTELHGGSVHVDSPGEGRGATFTIRFPLIASHERTKVPSRLTRGASTDGTGAHGTSSITLDGVQVLVVDDDRDTCQILSVVLTESRAEVQTAASAAEALEMLKWFKPDVLVSDLAMPDEDGYSLISRIRAHEAESVRETPAVALTAHVRVEDRARALSAGFNMFVPKPVEANELITTIANLLGAPKTYSAKHR
jgi:PAS domain S-box-containing protein